MIEIMLAEREEIKCHCTTILLSDDSRIEITIFQYLFSDNRLRRMIGKGNMAAGEEKDKLSEEND